MRVLLVRHCEAAPGTPDALRALTAAGLEAARALGATLAVRQPTAVISSPLLRARETAGPIARACSLRAETHEALAPGAGVADVRDAVRGRGEPVIVVGHQPDLSEIVLAADGREVAFPPGGVAEVVL